MFSSDFRWRAVALVYVYGVAIPEVSLILGSKFKFSVQVEWLQGKWMLTVKNGYYLHNHVVKPEVFRTKRSSIYDFLLQQGENVIMEDVDNMVQAIVSKDGEEDDDTSCNY
ncbi:hypothetical protein P43SY_009955 [Pythium insidiosum]|uniref:Uncharacterized protein n=1 Tax=Pythium insidiosum TaxID=114742 RepID=A0AAD5Q7B6_PYTIN|nr:hypothetical protein P43SY_009955 [Pythium insidiosum]